MKRWFKTWLAKRRLRRASSAIFKALAHTEGDPRIIRIRFEECIVVIQVPSKMPLEHFEHYCIAFIDALDDVWRVETGHGLHIVEPRP